MSDQEQHNSEGSEELFSVEEEDAYDGELPVLTYRQYLKSGNTAKRVILQTSDSSDDDDNWPTTQQPRVSTGRELARKDTTALRRNERQALASLAPQNSNNGASGKTVPPRKKMRRTAGIENMGQAGQNQTHQVSIASKSAATESHAPVENDTLHEIQKTNELLMQLVGRMKKTEQRVRSLENKIVSTSGPTSSSGSTPKRSQPRRKAVPPEVRVSIVHVYTCMC